MRGKFSPIGNLDRRITIKTVTRAANSYGEPVESYSTLTTVWAERLASGKPGTGGTGERYEQGQLTSWREVKWGIRYLSTIREDMIVEYDGEDYKITGIDEIGRKWGMILTTELKR